MQTPTHQMIEAFRAAILHGGIGAGADALGMSQSSMSRIIGELQRQVGFQLFVKHGRTVKPTEEALALMSKVQQSFLGLEDIGRFTEQLRKQRSGRLSVCAIPALGHSIIPEAIEFLRKKHPGVVVSLRIASSVEVAQSVRNRQTDLGFATQGVSLGELQTVAEFSADCVCIAQGTTRAEDRDCMELHELTRSPYVALTGTLQKRLEVLLAGAGPLDIMAEVTHSLSASELVLRGLGISVVDPFTGKLHRSRGGAAWPLRPALPFNVHALALGDTRLSAPARDLLQYVEAAARTLQDACA